MNDYFTSHPNCKDSLILNAISEGDETEENVIEGAEHPSTGPGKREIESPNLYNFLENYYRERGYQFPPSGW
jgi:hypothetical protein